MEWYIITAALLPAIILLFIIWKRDNIKHEPVWLIVLAFLVGSLSAPLSLVLSIPADKLWSVIMGDSYLPFIFSMYEAFCEAAIPEELAKFAILWLFLVKNKWFDEYMDGIVYAAAISLGFAGIENVLYLFNTEDWVVTGTMRALLSVPVHFGCGILMGYYYSLWRMEKRTNMLWMALGVPIFVHGTYDTIIFYTAFTETFSVIMAVLFLILLIKVRKFCKQSITSHLAKDTAKQISYSSGDTTIFSAMDQTIHRTPDISTITPDLYEPDKD